ncbi:hypothetical protein FHR83_003268 [Actinoplanes campanulatus]|uniref:DUF4240 domain-containing protein n=1 Tax=Actinoplanes campanulatus TaxID=113559 RepID=A0A7W5AG65_9ACTN|nr:DUF4240 domain-containing protein [Actinoplanes campanulatus]MBB3095598.1 hypothetical protein [Actinoplanes campanulatus]GGN10141.1 hypothetical protein GCM10010109_19730 [Actinoplanes campanulatus]GID36491.1 hypothetical protein Aca09nite_29970 [Actinoplanes campanulatus]
MELAEFWKLIESMGPAPEDDEFKALTERLATRPVADIIAFEDHLAYLLHALDTQAHARAARARGDWFLYVRCRAVASGQAVYQAVLDDPKQLRRFAKWEAELLLSVASEAYERGTGSPWVHESPVSYETGSNGDGWSGSRPPLLWRVLLGVARLLPRRRER